jgi:hypothetical protein
MTMLSTQPPSSRPLLLRLVAWAASVAVTALLLASAVSHGADGPADALARAQRPQGPPAAPVTDTRSERDDAPADSAARVSNLADQPGASAPDAARVRGGGDSTEDFDDPAALATAFSGVGGELDCRAISGGALRVGDAVPSSQDVRWDAGGVLKGDGVVTAKLAPGSGPIRVGLISADNQSTVDFSLDSMQVTVRNGATGMPLVEPNFDSARAVNRSGAMWLRLARRGDEIVGRVFTSDPATGAAPVRTVRGSLGDIGEQASLGAGRPVYAIIGYEGAATQVQELSVTR